MFGTALKMLLRLTIVMHGINTIKIIRTLKGCQSPTVTNDFILEVKTNVATTKDQFKIISVSSVKEAYKFLSYFHKIKLLFGFIEGFDIKTDDLETEMLRFMTIKNANKRIEFTSN